MYCAIINLLYILMQCIFKLPWHVDSQAFISEHIAYYLLLRMNAVHTNLRQHDKGSSHNSENYIDPK